jgi:hypothetical protein
MANQYWGDDLFTDGTPVYGTHPNLYTSIEPWTTNPEPTTGYGLNVDDGEIFDGHQRASSASMGLAAFVRRAGVGDFSGWCVARQHVLDNASVTMYPGIKTLAGVPDNDSFKQFGVCSHVSGGTLTSPGGDDASEYYTNVAGYFLIEAKTSANRHRVFMLEVGLTTPGTITVITSQNVSATDPLHNAGGAADYFPPTRLRLRVDTSGGTALIDCFRTTNAGQEVALFGGQLVRGTPLADGRCGFGCQTRRTTASGHESVGLINEFTIRSVDEATLHFNDRFSRSQPRLGRDRTDGTAGFSLASAWAGDGKTWFNNLTNCAELLQRGGTAGQMEVGKNNTATTADYPGFHLWQNPPPQRSQRFATTIRRLNVDTNTRTETGLLMRFSLIPTPSGAVSLFGRYPASYAAAGLFAGSNKTGYSVYVVHDTSATPVWQLEVKHFSGESTSGYVGDLLATADLSGFGLVVGTSYVLDVEIRNTDGTSFGQGDFVAIKVLLDSSPVTPALLTSNPPLGVATLDDILFDTRSAAQNEAGGVGVYFNPDAMATANMCAFLDFSEQTLTDPPRAEPDEQATISIAAETAAVSGTLATQLSATVSESVITEPLVHRFESGTVQPIRMQARERTRYSVSATMEKSAWTSLLALYGVNGAHTPLNWTHPYTGAAHIVLFVEDSITFEARHIELAGGTVYETSFSLDLVFDQSTFNPGL